MAAFSRRPVSSHLREGGLLRFAKDECWKCNFLGEEWFRGETTQWACTPCSSGGKAPPHFHRLERKAFFSSTLTCSVPVSSQGNRTVPPPQMGWGGQTDTLPGLLQFPDTLATPLAGSDASWQSIPPSHKYPSPQWGLITGGHALWLP